MRAYFELFNRPEGPYFFHLCSYTHEVLLIGEPYPQRSMALNAIDAVRQRAPVQASYQRRIAPQGQHFFLLLAMDGQTLGRSELHTTSMALDRCMASCMLYASRAMTRELMMDEESTDK